MIEAVNLTLVMLAVAMTVRVLFLAVQLGAALLPGERRLSCHPRPARASPWWCPLTMKRRSSRARSARS